ncbi:MAG: KTSC domain-containing protein [Niabella sp.]|nr:KTSC domain-containing protein [Niabella sp.]
MPSTVIAHVDYNPETKTLEIRFVSGAVYHYHKVPAAIYQKFKTAQSKGTYFNQFIKDVYPFERRA